MTYSITSISRLTGVPSSTLRTWERRYGVPSPTRHDNGRRTYGAEDLEQVRVISELVASGHPVGDLAKLPLESLQRLRGSLGPGAPEDIGARIVRRLFDAIAEGDYLGYLGQLRQAYLLMQPLAAAETVVAPLLWEVGTAWAEGRLTPYSEHLATALARQVIMSSANALGPTSEGAVRMIFTTPRGELHEMGALMAWHVARWCGAEAIYLGPDLPAEEIAAAAGALKADVVALSLISVANVGKVEADLRRLGERLPPDAELWVGKGGACPIGRDASLGERVVVFEQLRDFADRLTARR